MILRDNNGDNGEPDHRCVGEIVKEILGHRGPASKLHEARVSPTAGETRKIANPTPNGNGAYSTRYTVKRSKPPLSLF